MNKKSYRALLLTLMMVLANMGGIPTIFADSSAFNVLIYTPTNDSTVTYCESPILIEGGFGPGLSPENHLDLYYKSGSATYEGTLSGWTYIGSIENIKDGKYKDWAYDWLPAGLTGTYSILALGYDGDHPVSPVAYESVSFELVYDCDDDECTGAIEIDSEMETIYDCADLGSIWPVYGSYSTDGCCFACGGDSCKINVYIDGPDSYNFIGTYDISTLSGDWEVDWDTGTENVTCGTYNVIAKMYCNDILSAEDELEIEIVDSTKGTEIIITAPEDGGPYDCTLLDIEGTLSDCCNYVDYIEVYVNGNLVDNITSGFDDGTWESSFTPGSTGDYIITAYAMDMGTALDSDSVEIYTDCDCPAVCDVEIVITAPEDGGPYDCTLIDIEGTLDDSCEDVDYIEVYVNGNLVDNITSGFDDGTWESSFTPGGTGQYTITAYAMDMGTSLDCDSVDIYADCYCPPCTDISINMTEPATCGPCLCGPITFKGTLEGSACVDHVDIYYMLEDGCNDYTPEGILEFAVLNGDFRTCPPEGTFAVSTTNIDASGNWEVVWNESCDLSIPGLYKFIAVAEPKVQDGLPCVYDVEYSCVNNYWDISIDEPYGLICENTQMSGTIQIPFCCDAIETVDISYYDGCEWICLGTTEIVWANSCDCGCTPCEGSCCDSQYGTWTFCIDPCTLPNGCVEIKAEAVGTCGSFNDITTVLIGNGASVEICEPDDCDLLCGVEYVSGEISMMCESDCGCDVPVNVYISEDGYSWEELTTVAIMENWTENTYYECIDDCVDTTYMIWEVPLYTCQYEDGCYYIKAVVSDSCGCDSYDQVVVKINNTVDIEIIAPEEGDNWYCEGGSLTAYVMTQCDCFDEDNIGAYISDDGGDTWEELDVSISGPCLYHVACDCGCCEPCSCYDECMDCTCPDCGCSECLCDGYGFVTCTKDVCGCRVTGACGCGYFECDEERADCENLYTWKITDCFESCDLEDGEYTIMVNASGPCGPVSDCVTFTVDNSADLTILNDGCNEVCGIVNITGAVTGCLVDGIDVYYGCDDEWIYLGTVEPYESSESIVINNSCGCGGGTTTILNDSGIYVWSILWDTCDLPNGPYTIRAVAYDLCDNELEEEVCLYVFNQIPTIEITGPGCDESVCGLVTITGIGANCTCANGLEFYYAPKEGSDPEEVSEWTEFAYIYLDPYDASNAWCELCDCEDGTHLWYANLTTCNLDDGYYWIRAEAVGDCGSLVNETSCIYVNATVDLEMIVPNMDSGIYDFSGQEIIRGTSENSDCIENITLWYHLCDSDEEDWWNYLGEATIDENGDWEYIWNTCEAQNGCYCIKAVVEGICPGNSAETEVAMVDVLNSEALISIESPESDNETGLYGIIPVAGTLEGWKCVDAITVNARFIGDIEDEGDDGEWISAGTVDPTGYDWSLGWNSYGIDNGMWEIKANATGFEDSYTEDSVYVLINNSGDGIGATPVYAYYTEGSEYIIVKFTEPVEIIDGNAVDETFTLMNGDFGTGATMSVIDGNKVQIMLGSDANIDYIGLYGYDEGASAIAPKAGQTNLYSTDDNAPVSGDFEDIAAGMIVVTDGTIFSVPTFVNTEMMLEKAGIEEGAFVQFVTGEWEDLADCGCGFVPLIGYLYENPEDGVYEMPVYTTRQGELSEVKVEVANDYNLLALNNNLKENMFENADAGDWLWSLTKSSSSFMYVGSVFDADGSLVGTYEMSSARFKLGGTYTEVSPYTAYWVPYAGTDGDTFYGLTMA